MISQERFRVSHGVEPGLSFRRRLTMENMIFRSIIFVIEESTAITTSLLIAGMLLFVFVSLWKHITYIPKGNYPFS
jgi:hypothetical protein